MAKCEVCGNEYDVWFRSYARTYGHVQVGGGDTAFATPSIPSVRRTSTRSGMRSRSIILPGLQVRAGFAHSDLLLTGTLPLHLRDRLSQVISSLSPSARRAITTKILLRG